MTTKSILNTPDFEIPATRYYRGFGLDSGLR